jgi:hypothetical protein
MSDVFFVSDGGLLTTIMFIQPTQVPVCVIVVVVGLMLAFRERSFAQDVKRTWTRVITAVIAVGRVAYVGLIVRFMLYLSSYQESYADTCTAINYRGVFLPLLSINGTMNITNAPGDPFQTFVQYANQLTTSSVSDVAANFVALCRRAGCARVLGMSDCFHIVVFFFIIM